MLLQLITGMFDGIFGFVAGIFPDSPFGDLHLATQGMATGIGWLNWLFPVGDCMTLFLAWIGVCVALAAARFLYGKVDGLKDMVMGKQ